MAVVVIGVKVMIVVVINVSGDEGSGFQCNGAVLVVVGVTTAVVTCTTGQ